MECPSPRIGESARGTQEKLLRGALRVVPSHLSLFLSALTLLHFSLQLAVQSLHQRIVFSIWAQRLRRSSSSSWNKGNGQQQLE